ncbi:MAG TPA: protein kinase [Pyrinomonadaceae bacterium]|jgi:serine/threonine-protein kinase
MIGNVVGNYKVVQKIGEGGMGAVYKGVDLMLEREVAIKVLKPELASQPQVVERFRSEAVTLAKLNHPNIATLYNFFRQGDNFFMVLEFVNGTPLEKLIEAHGVMTCEQAIPLFCQMLEGIDHAHSFGIIHRDIKPANMMLTQSGLLKVLDFGIARALGTARMTRAGHLIGTIEYMSPEQVRGLETDARSDIYSLGMVLYEMLTGRVPFASDSEFELMKAQVEQLPTPPREFAPSIPEQVEWAILCATEKNPEKRFQTAGAFGEAIVDSVTTAMASGELSQIDMRGSTSRLSAVVVGRDRFASRISGNSSPGFSDGSGTGLAPSSASAETGALPAATRLAATTGDGSSVTSPLKATRLGNPTEFALNYATATSPGDSLSKVSTPGGLSRKQYLWGGLAVGVVFMGFVLIALAIFLRGSRSNDAQASPPAATNAAPVVQATPNATEEAESQVEPEKRGGESRDQTSPIVIQPTEEARDQNTPVVSPTEPRITKTARANPPARNKPRRSSRDIMGVP